MTLSQIQMYEMLTSFKNLDDYDLGFCLTVLRDNLPEVSCNDFTFECLNLILKKLPK